MDSRDLILRLKHFRWFAFAILASLTVTAGAQTILSRNAQWPPQAGTSYSYGGPYEIVSTACPTSPTTIGTAASHHLLGLWFHNPTGGSAITITFKDKQGSPAPLPLDGVAVAAGQDVVFNTPFGLLASGGMTLTCSGSGATYSVVYTN